MSYPHRAQVKVVVRNLIRHYTLLVWSRTVIIDSKFTNFCMSGIIYTGD